MTFDELEEYKKELHDYISLLKDVDVTEDFYPYGSRGFKHQRVLDKTHKHRFIKSNYDFIEISGKKIPRMLTIEYVLLILNYEYNKVNELITEYSNLKRKLL